MSGARTQKVISTEPLAACLARWHGGRGTASWASTLNLRIPAMFKFGTLVSHSHEAYIHVYTASAGLIFSPVRGVASVGALCSPSPAREDSGDFHEGVYGVSELMDFISFG